MLGARPDDAQSDRGPINRQFSPDGCEPARGGSETGRGVYAGGMRDPTMRTRRDRDLPDYVRSPDIRHVDHRHPDMYRDDLYPSPLDQGPSAVNMLDSLPSERHPDRLMRGLGGNPSGEGLQQSHTGKYPRNSVQANTGRRRERERDHYPERERRFVSL